MDERLPSRHLDALTIAELDAGVLDAVRAAGVSAHLATCRSCRSLQADLSELSQLLGMAPAAPMPADVVERIESALAAAATTRDATPPITQSGAGPVVQLERRRRWLAPLAAAAVTLAAISVGTELVQQNGGGTDGATSAHPAQDTFVEGGLRTDGDPLAGKNKGRTALELSSESFRRDVARKVFGRAAEYRPSKLKEAERCTPDRIAGAGEPLPVLLDGRRAFLYFAGPRSDRLAVAVSCRSGRPIVAARAHLDLD